MRVTATCFFFSSRRRHTRWTGHWSSDVCSSDLRARDSLQNNVTQEADLPQDQDLSIDLQEEQHEPGHGNRYAGAVPQLPLAGSERPRPTKGDRKSVV